MLDEPGLSPRSPAAQFWGRCPAISAGHGTESVDPNLSTGYASWQRLRSTATSGAFHNRADVGKEGVA